MQQDKNKEISIEVLTDEKVDNDNIHLIFGVHCNKGKCRVLYDHCSLSLLNKPGMFLEDSIFNTPDIYQATPLAELNKSMPLKDYLHLIDLNSDKAKLLKEDIEKYGIDAFTIRSLHLCKKKSISRIMAKIAWHFNVYEPGGYHRILACQNCGKSYNPDWIPGESKCEKCGEMCIPESVDGQPCKDGSCDVISNMHKWFPSVWDPPSYKN